MPMQHPRNYECICKLQSKRLFIIGFILSSTLIASLRLSSQSIDSLFRPAGFIVSYEYVLPQFVGDHVFSQSLSDWRGFNFALGLSIYDRAEVHISIGRMDGTLIDQQYLFYGGETRVRKIQIKAPIKRYKRITYLYPDFSYGNTKTSLAGKINGDLIEVANNFSLDLTNNIKLTARIAYQRTRYDITTNDSLRPLFELSHAMIPSIGLQYHTRMTKNKRYRWKVTSLQSVQSDQGLT